MARRRWVCLSPGDIESKIRRSFKTMRDPTLVPWLSRLRSVRHTVKSEGTRQNSSILWYKECLRLCEEQELQVAVTRVPTV